MESNIKKQIPYLACLFILLCLFSLNLNAQTTDFSGTWKLNVGKSDFGSVPETAAVQQYVIKQDKQELNLSWVTKNEKGEEITSKLKLPLDGSSVSVLLQPSQKTRSSSAKMSEDGKSLLLSKSYSKAGMPTEVDYTLKEKWQLINDGKDLLIELTSPAYTIKAVYSRPVVSTVVTN